jgi:beta-exotoxin I transport system permease protein
MTRTTRVLARHSIRRMRAIVIGVGLVLAGFQFLLTQVATYLQRTQAFGLLTTLLPEFMRQLAGPSMLLSFTGVVSLGYFHPIVLTTFVGLAVAIATEAASEIELRFVDLTLARPARRTDLVTRTVLVLIVAGSVVLAMMAAGTWIGLTCCTPADAPRPAASTIAALAVSLAVVAWCWGGIALAAAMLAKRRATAAAVAGVAALATYLLDYLGRVWEPVRGLSRVSPFHYFEPMPLIAGDRLNAAHVGVLVAAGLAGIILSYWVVSRRDL